MEPSTAEQLSVQVRVEGQDFTWTPDEGLDPEVVMTVKGFIWWKAHALSRPAAQAGLSVEDLVNEGFLGALRAAQRFLPTASNKFLSFACYHILERMHTAIGAREVYLPLKHRKAHRQAGTTPVVGSLESYGAEGRTMKAEPLAAEAEANEERDLVRAALGNLAARDRQILEGLFGIGGREAMTLSEIGAEMGFTKQRAQQVKSRAMLRLRLELTKRGVQ